MNLKFINWLRHSSPYINLHRGSTMVLMLPGIAIESKNFLNIIHDLALLRSLQVKIVIVHGARPQINSKLSDIGSSTYYHKDTRITSKSDLSIVLQTVGELRYKIESALSAGLPNSPMFGSKIRVLTGNFITAKPLGVDDGHDYQYSGSVRRVDREGVLSALESDSIVLISPVGISLTGDMYNLKFNEIATRVATSIKADRFISYTSDDGFKSQDGMIINELTLADCERYLEKLNIVNLRSQSLRACYDVCSNGLKRAQIVSYKKDGALLKELYTREGSGTLVYIDNYENVRSAKIEDIVGIIKLIRPLEAKGLLVERTRESLERDIHNFTVLEKEGIIIACASLYRYDKDKAELACVATHKDYQGGGRAAKVINKINSDAKNLGLKEIFVLTTKAAHWFVEQGFEESNISRLPEKKQRLYNFQRNSKIYFKVL